jgi:hypothetical protein
MFTSRLKKIEWMKKNIETMFDGNQISAMPTEFGFKTNPPDDFSFGGGKSITTSRS